MGLDMYLSKTKRIGKVTIKELNTLDNYFDYVTRPNKYRDSTPQKWGSFNMEDVNMDLTADYITEYVYRYSYWDTEKEYGFRTIFQQIGYWRKANHIHNWFVENVQNGVDDCGVYEVKKYHLEELLRVCKEVLNTNKLVVGKELLPTKDGFFFGGVDYDAYYYLDVKNTIEIIEKVLETTDFKHEIVMYHASW